MSANVTSTLLTKEMMIERVKALIATGEAFMDAYHQALPDDTIVAAVDVDGLIECDQLRATFAFWKGWLLGQQS